MTQLEDAVRAATNDARVQAVLLALPLLETGSYTGPWNVGDTTLAPSNGPSYGPYQINVGSKANPSVTRSQAENVPFAVHFMLPRVQAAVSSISNQQWLNDPKGSVKLAAERAGKPAQPYSTARFNDVWTQLHGGNGSATSVSLPNGITDKIGGFAKGIINNLPVFGPITQGLGDLGGIGDAAGKIGDAVSWFTEPTNWLRILMAIVGLALLVGGLLHASGTDEKISEVASTAAVAA